jgi:hypothetical protein
VAVHGLGGDALGTWTTGKTLWLRDLLPNSPGFDQARIMTFGYDASAFLVPFDRCRSTGRVYTFAENLLSELYDMRSTPSERSRPIIWVGHSLGGIVIKQVSAVNLVSLCY